MPIKPTSYEITRSVLKKPTTDKGLAWFWGVLDTHCYLVGKGVRTIAMISPFWDDDQHKQNYPEIQKLIQAYGLKIKPDTAIIDNKRSGRYWRYYIYSKGHLKEVNQIIALFRRIHLIPKTDRKRAYPLHRQIGRLLGYSSKAINNIYR